MEKLNQPGETSWGVRLNPRPSRTAADPPAWVSKGQREKWNKPGLVVWDQKTETIAHFTATQALQILEQLSATEAWKQGEVTLGEPATWISLDEPEQGPERVLTNEIYLSPDRTAALLERLERAQPDLEVQKKEEEDERARIIAEIIGYVLSDRWGQEKTLEAGETS